MPNARRVGEPVNVFKVFFGDLEWPGCDIGNVFANQFAGIDGGFVDLLEQEGSERLHAGTKESAVEWHVDTLQRDCRKATLKDDGFRFGLSHLPAFFDDFNKVGFDVFQGHGLHQGLDVNLLSLQDVENIREAVKSAKL